MPGNNRLRAIVGQAVTWGVALSAFATSTLAVGVMSGLVPGTIYGIPELVAVARNGLLAGAVAGGLFGWFMSSRERGATVSTLSRGRVATWGFIAAGAVPCILAMMAGPLIPTMVIAAAAGGAGIGGSLFGLSLLRAARRDHVSLPDNGHEFDRLGR